MRKKSHTATYESYSAKSDYVTLLALYQHQVLAQNLTKYVDEAMQKDDPYILTEESIASL